MSEGHFRRAARNPVELRVYFRRDEPGAALEQAGRVRDLGMGGAFIATPRLPEVGSAIAVTLHAPTAWDPLELPAEVRWLCDADETAARGFGLKFRVLTPSQANALYDLLATTGFTGRAIADGAG